MPDPLLRELPMSDTNEPLPVDPPAAYALADGRVALELRAPESAFQWLIVDGRGHLEFTAGALPSDSYLLAGALGSTAERTAGRAVAVDRVVREWRASRTDLTAMWAALGDLSDVWPR